MKKDSFNNSTNKRKKINIILLIVAILFFLTNIFTLVFFLQKEKGLLKDTENKYSFLNPARNIFQNSDLIINVQPLRDEFNKIGEDPDVSIYFEYLPTGASIAINKEAEFFPASLTKVPAAMAVAKKIERGEWKWRNELVLMSADKDDRFGSLYKEETNSTHTIEDLVRRSLSESDNTAHFILLRNLEVSEVEDVYGHMGLKGYLDTDGKLSAKRYSVIFRSLYNSSYLTEENSQKLLSFLTQSEFNEFIQSVLPPDIPFAHKIGISDDNNVFLDSGIAYNKNRPYILTVMIKTGDGQKAKEIMKDISEKVYNYINNYIGSDD